MLNSSLLELVFYLFIGHLYPVRGLRCLVGVGKAAHARHHTQNVVVDGVDADLRRVLALHRVDGQRQVERRLVDTGEVARAAGLVLLRLQREGIHVDTRAGRARVVLPRLDLVEVAALTLGEAVLTVELDLGDLHRVLALALDTALEQSLRQQVVGRALEQVDVTGTRAVVQRGARGQTTRTPAETGERGTDALVSTRRGTGTNARREHRVGGDAAERRTREAATDRRGDRTTTQDVHDDALRGPVVRVVERLLTSRLRDPRDRRAVAVDEAVALDNPDEFLHRVVEVHLDLVGGGSDRLVARELDLVDQVLVALLGEAAALLRVQVDVVDVQGRSDQLELADGRDAVAQGDAARLGGELTHVRVDVGVAAVVVLLELDIDADLVVLERDERDRQTRVAAVPELQRDVQRLERRAGAGDAGVRQLALGARRIQGNTVSVLEENKVRRVADHVIERRLGADGLRQLSPDLHPVAVLAVDAGATDLDLDLLDQAVTHIVEPAEAAARGRELDLGERDLDIRAVHQVGVTADDSRHAATEVRLTVEGHLDRLHGEVGVALVEHLPERDLGVARDIDILCAVADKLH